MTLILTPPAVLSYPALIKPRLGPNPRPGQEAVYSATLVFLKDADLKPLKDAAMSALIDRFGADDVKKMLQSTPPKIRIPFRSDADKYDAEKYGIFINVTNKSKPGLVNRYAGSDGKPAPLDAEKFYPGCFVKAALSVYVYDQSGNKGVAFGLQHLQWWADGERLDSRVNASDAFTAEARPEGDLGAFGAKAEPGANLSDLLN